MGLALITYVRSILKSSSNVRKKRARRWIYYREIIWFTSGELCDTVSFGDKTHMELTPDILKQMMPTLPKSKRDLYAPMLDASMAEFEINNERRVAAYLANLAHESQNLTRWEENLNYSAKRLMEVWPNRFPTIEAATPFAHNPEALANKVYGGRMGNNRPGDGWKYRGRFPLQCTGKDLYRKASEALGIPTLFTDPDSCMENPLIGFRVSAWIFAVEKGGNRFADKLQIKALTKAINGGYNGLAERIELFNRGLRILPDNFRLTANAIIPSKDKEVVPDFIEGAETEEDVHPDIEDQNNQDKGVTTIPVTEEAKKTETEGALPPVPAVPIKASAPSLLSKLTALSMPTGAGVIITGIFTFIKGIPPWGWGVIGGLFVVMTIVGAWLYNESMKRADNRTARASAAAADKDKNNIRYV